MPRHNEQFRFFRRPIAASAPRLADVWPFEPFDGRRRWTVRAVERVLRGANDFNVDVYAGQSAGSPVVPGSVALALGPGTQIQVNGFAYELVHPVSWDAPTAVGDEAVAIWDPENVSGIGGLDKLAGPGGRVFGVVAILVQAGNYHAHQAQIDAGLGWALPRELDNVPGGDLLLHAPDDFFSNDNYLDLGQRNTRVGGLDLRYFGRHVVTDTYRAWIHSNLETIFPGSSGEVTPDANFLSAFSSLQSTYNPYVVRFPHLDLARWPSATEYTNLPRIFSTEPSNVQLTIQILRNPIDGARHWFRSRLGDFTEIIPLPNWIDPETLLVREDHRVDAIPGSLQVEYVAHFLRHDFQEGDIPPLMGRWGATGFVSSEAHLENMQRLGFVADASGRDVGFTSVAVKHFGYSEQTYGQKYVSPSEYLEIYHDFVAAHVNHFKRNSALMESRRLWAPRALADSIPSQLNNSYVFTNREELRYTPRQVYAQWRDIPPVYGRIVAPRGPLHDAEITYEGVTEYRLIFRVLSLEDFGGDDRPDIDEEFVEPELTLEGPGEFFQPIGNIFSTRDISTNRYVVIAAPRGVGGDLTTTRLFTVRPPLITDIGILDIVSLLDQTVSEDSIVGQVRRAWVRIVERTSGVEVVAAQNTAGRDIMNRQVVEQMTIELRQTALITIGQGALDPGNREWTIIGIEEDSDRRDMIVRLERTTDHQVVDSPYGKEPIPIRFSASRSQRGRER